MKNIINSQIKQLFKSKLKFIVLLICCALSGYIVFGTWLDYYALELLPEISASQVIIYNWSSVITMVFFFAALSVGDICAGDFKDKTVYTELMSGCKRSGTYFGRAVVALVFTLIGSLVIVCTPVLISTVIFGWGTLVTVGDFVTRVLVLIVPIIRIICEFVCISFIVKNKYFVIGIAFGFVEFQAVLGNLMDKAPAELLGITSFERLCTFDFWATYGLDDRGNIIASAALPAGEMASIYIWSVIVSAAAIWIGYSFFHRDDLD